VTSIALDPDDGREEAIGQHGLKHQRPEQRTTQQPNGPEFSADREQMPSPRVESADDDVRQRRQADQSKMEAIRPRLWRGESLAREIVCN
jgi:hypothetical protein